ncbi:hypothetical protein MRB53_040641 [Persea americana]|nr:hypothetical protein MRB53_040641 [Persea americana]
MDSEVSASREGSRLQSHTSIHDPGTDAFEPNHPQPSFHPFFAVVEDAETGEFCHPTVHYIFEDDDSSLLTATAIEMLESNTTAIHIDDAADQVAIIDLHSDGQRIMNVASISTGWQALRAEIMQAPSWGHSPQSNDNGMMLKLSGRDIQSSTQVDAQPVGDIGELLEKFDRELELLNDIMQNAERTEAD